MQDRNRDANAWWAPVFDNEQVMRFVQGQAPLPPNPPPQQPPAAHEFEVRLVGGTYRSIDPNTGRSFMCLLCREHYARNKFGLCAACSMCQRCFRYSIADMATRRCMYCICHFCKGTKDDMYSAGVWMDSGKPYRPDLGQPLRDEFGNMRATQDVRVCLTCYTKFYLAGRIVCRSCKQATALSYHRRGDKKPTICANCATRQGPDFKNVHYCCFCPNKATTTLGRYLVCKECKTLRSCLKGDCTPRNPCKPCKTVQAENAVIVAQNREERRVAAVLPLRQVRPSEHNLQADGTCYPYPQCYACAVLFESIMLAAPPDPMFVRADDPRERRTNRSRRFIGVEVEVCGLKTYRIVPKLRSLMGDMGGAIVHDGSLPQGGFELNLPPLAGDHFLEKVNEVCAVLAEGGAWVNRTYSPEVKQAGLHVHIDASDHTYADMKKLLFLYSVIEPALIRTQPHSRVMVGQDNGHGRLKRYCIPCGERYKDGIVHLAQPKDKFKTALKSKMLVNLYGEDGAPPRKERHPQRAADVHYYALNVHSWFYRGTIECRLHTGTVNPQTITKWGMLWASIVDSAYRTTETQLRTLMETAERIPATRLATLLSLAPSDEVRTYINSRYKKYAADYGDI